MLFPSAPLFVALLSSVSLVLAAPTPAGTSNVLLDGAPDVDPSLFPQIPALVGAGFGFGTRKPTASSSSVSSSALAAPTINTSEAFVLLDQSSKSKPKLKRAFTGGAPPINPAFADALRQAAAQRG